MYEALVRKDAAYEGIFITAVKTTGIFCRPTCTARKPKFENVEFFSSTKEALDHGYRPCKRCTPMRPLDAKPSWLSPVEEALREFPERKIRDQDLRQLGIDPSQVRRWFKKHHGITFQAYQRSLRLNRAFGTLREGQPVTMAAYSQGYESVSGFHEAFRNRLGTVPSKVAATGSPIHIRRMTTPLGPMLAGTKEERVCLVEFADRRMLETQLDRLQKYFKSPLLPGSSATLDLLERQLHEYFMGQLKEFTVPLANPGTPFQQEVWTALQRIPYGQTASYQQLADGIGRKKAVRAVASANGDNRIAILIPCHRIIGSDGKLRGYGGGLWRKKWLLDLEQKHR
ncbi:MAG: methylated-DNA--[protein]-cysteine S-methyltransferase [Saprospiraceae bacterium]|nr:methylated-DNA--[protein]-cysteine S-methyltransferase [Saprospiraceae bacterium]